MIIDNERLSMISIAIPQEIVTTPKQHIIVLCIRCFDFLLHVGFLAFVRAIKFRLRTM